jgi:glycosyltransferase domain-containing protein
MTEFTILIPVYHQHEKLYRLLSFLESYKEDFKVIILDSRVQKTKISANFGFKYFAFDSNIALTEKIYQGLGFVKTKYSVICADDDFVIPSSIAECVDFLSLNKDYVVAHGQYISFLTDVINKRKVFFWSKRYNTDSNEINTPMLRIKKYFDTPMSPNFYGVYRTKDHRLIMKTLERKSDSDIRFEERLQASVSLLIGKEKRLSSFYYAREKVKKKTKIDDMDSYIKNNTFDCRYRKYKNTLMEFVDSNDYLMIDNFENQIDKYFLDFVGKLTIRNEESFLDLVRRIVIKVKPLYDFVNFILRRKSLYERTMLSDDEIHGKYKDVLKVKKALY